MFKNSAAIAQRLARSRGQTRFASTKSVREVLEEVVPKKQLQLKQLKTEHSQAVIGEIKVEHVVGGHSLPRPQHSECQKVLPPAPGGKEVIAESMLWLLLTGKVPTEAETRQLSRELAEKGELPEYIEKLIDSLPSTLHPMTQLGMGVAALNHESKFQAAYERGIKKSEYWTYALEDSLDLLARLPTLAARIYRNVYHPGKPIPKVNKDLDLVGNYVNMLGFGDNHDLTEYLRLYIAIHGDHEGGNASAHTSHLVGSTLADPYLSYAAGLYALAGPCTGTDWSLLANQEVLRWQMNMQKELGDVITHDNIKDFLWRTLKSGQVVPGYGHGVLRNPDPRFDALLKFCDTRPGLMADPIVQLSKRRTFEVAPGVLKEHGKSKNPYPNVDAASGCVLYHYGLQEFKYYTVIFGVSRALGCLTQYVWSRALGLPIERPKSLSMDAILQLVK
ncbi:citrate synthase-like protein [Epithele typhae]|uniref:citrate synthase-like protein n=1 Tax=Epithele typhae TaxID=378194 RepID=UPI00200774F9|nr:citrate synthase-like protein [Epithele typhae]KAH9946022.1 citrate synthase-like protein [Epithele typhae]